MAHDSKSIKEYFARAESLRAKVETGGSNVQPLVSEAIQEYENALKTARELSLFSVNEDLDDISTNDIQYLLIPCHVAQLTFRRIDGNRRDHLRKSRRAYEQFLNQLDSYDILDKDASRSLERYQDNPNNFSIVASVDAAQRREVKIANFRAEKALKDKVEHLRQNPHALQNDDAALRDLRLTEVALCVKQAFQSLESIALELSVLSKAPAVPRQQEDGARQDARARRAPEKGYSERLDPSISQLAANGPHGPILGNDGRPLRPFTLLDTRQRMQQGVFQPDHSLPTMTIDEYLEEERKRGGIIDGGGPQSQQRAQVDEDDIEKADEATIKAREWDEYVEQNPKGSGNTMNLG